MRVPTILLTLLCSWGFFGAAHGQSVLLVRQAAGPVGYAARPLPGRLPPRPVLTVTPALAGAPADSLPAGMPLHTRLLWGHGGLLRTVGLAPSTRRAELQLRRAMLQWHQRLGLLTFGAMTTQVVLGELLAADPARHYASLQPVHRTLGYATFGSYMATASLSLTAPPARRYGGGFSSVRLHRYLALIHFTGMAAQPFLGRALADARTAEDHDRLLTTHRWVGRVTYAAFTTALFSIFLPF